MAAHSSCFSDSYGIFTSSMVVPTEGGGDLPAMVPINRAGERQIFGSAAKSILRSATNGGKDLR